MRLALSLAAVMLSLAASHASADGCASGNCRQQFSFGGGPVPLIAIHRVASPVLQPTATVHRADIRAETPQAHVSVEPSILARPVVHRVRVLNSAIPRSSVQGARYTPVYRTRVRYAPVYHAPLYSASSGGRTSTWPAPVYDRHVSPGCRCW